jgi:MORN repeat
MNWPDGSRYEGIWNLNQAHGKGKFYYVNKDQYEGEWKCNKASG